MSFESGAIYLTALVASLGLMLALGVWVARRTSTGEDFLLAGRRLGTPLLLGTTLATLVGTGSSLGAVGFAYESGWAGALYGIGGAAGVFGVVWLFADVLLFAAFSVMPAIAGLSARAMNPGMDNTWPSPTSPPRCSRCGSVPSCSSPGCRRPCRPATPTRHRRDHRAARREPAGHRSPAASRAQGALLPDRTCRRDDDSAGVRDRGDQHHRLHHADDLDTLDGTPGGRGARDLTRG